MQLTIDPELTKAGLSPFAYQLSGQNAPSLPAFWQAELDPVLAHPPFATPQAVNQAPNIAALRAVYKQLGKDPSRFRPSPEALWRRVVQGKGLYQVNLAVDLNNALSLRFELSLGLYDLAAVQGPVYLTVGKAGATYAGIGKTLNLEHLIVAEDAVGPFGSPTSDSLRTLTGETATAMLMVAYAPATFAARAAFEQALQQLVATYLHGQVIPVAMSH